MTRRSLSRGFVVLAVTAVIELAVEARADAPVGQYAYFILYDVVITDDRTGLTWQRGFGQVSSFGDAASYCQGSPLPSPHGWRVPSYKELLTLVDERPHISYFTGAGLPAAIDERAFPETPTDQPYWSSSLRNAQAMAYVVDFSDGTARLEGLNTALYYVRCVENP